MSESRNSKLIKRKPSDLEDYGREDKFKKADRKRTPPRPSSRQPETTEKNAEDDEDYDSENDRFSVAPTLATDDASEFDKDYDDYDEEDGDRGSSPTGGENLSAEWEEYEDDQTRYYHASEFSSVAQVGMSNKDELEDSFANSEDESNGTLSSGQQTPRPRNHGEDEDTASEATSVDGDSSSDYEDVTLAKRKAMAAKKRKSMVFNSTAHDERRTELGIMPDQIDQLFKTHGIFIDRKVLYKNFVRDTVTKIKASIPTEEDSTAPTQIPEEENILFSKETDPAFSPTIGIRAHIAGLIQPTKGDDARREEMLMAARGILLHCKVPATSTNNPHYTSSTVTRPIMTALGNWSFEERDKGTELLRIKASEYENNIETVFCQLPQRDENAPALKPLHPSLLLDSWTSYPHRAIIVSLFMISDYFEKVDTETFVLPIPSSWMKVTTALPKVVYSAEYSVYFTPRPKGRNRLVSTSKKAPAARLRPATGAEGPGHSDNSSTLFSPPKLGWQAQKAIMEADHLVPTYVNAPLQSESSPFVEEYIRKHAELYAYSMDDDEPTKRGKALALHKALRKDEKAWNDDAPRREFARAYGYDSDKGHSPVLVGVMEDKIQVASKRLKGTPTFLDPFSQLGKMLKTVPISKLHQWLALDGGLIKQRTSEAAVVSTINSYVTGFFVDSDLEEEWSVPSDTPLFTRLFGTDPAPDYVVRIRREELGDWPRQLRPCVFVHETKTESTQAARAQLAMSCVTTLLILTRAFTHACRPDDKMPAWMVVHGLVHTREGFTWYAHYPRAVPNGKENGKLKWKWEWVSQLVTQKFAHLYLSRTSVRHRMLGYSALLMIRAHVRQLVTHLKKWAIECAQRGQGPMDDIIASVYDQLGEWDKISGDLVFE